MKKIFNIAILMASLMVIPACHYEIDDVFDQPSSVRIQEEMARVDNILKSAENGWLIEYYGAVSYGGYNMICKFNEDNTVLAQSEIYGTATATSHYKFEQSQGVVLSFDEYNEIIHFFSDPDNPLGVGDDGDGMEGDFEFRVMEANSDMVVLKGKKHGSKIVMKPLAQDVVWNDYLAQVAEIEESMSAPAYVITVGEKKIVASGSYRQLTYTDTESGEGVNIPYIVTDKGFRLYRDLTIDGKTASEFIYSDTDEKCYADGDNTFSIEVRIPPLTETVQLGYWTPLMSASSASAQAYFNYAKEGDAAVGEQIQYLYLGTGALFGAGYNTGWGIVFLSSGYLGNIYFKAEIVDDDTIKMTATGYDSNGEWYYKNAGFSAIVQVLSGTFDLSTDNIKNPSWIKFQSVADPDLYITFASGYMSMPLG